MQDSTGFAWLTVDADSDSAIFRAVWSNISWFFAWICQCMWFPYSCWWQESPKGQTILCILKWCNSMSRRPASAWLSGLHDRKKHFDQADWAWLCLLRDCLSAVRSQHRGYWVLRENPESMRVSLWIRQYGQTAEENRCWETESLNIAICRLAPSDGARLTYEKNSWEPRGALCNRLGTRRDKSTAQYKQPLARYTPWDSYTCFFHAVGYTFVIRYNIIFVWQRRDTSSIEFLLLNFFYVLLCWTEILLRDNFCTAMRSLQLTANLICMMSFFSQSGRRQYGVEMLPVSFILFTSYCDTRF